jgi:hypothetical protein
MKALCVLLFPVAAVAAPITTADYDVLRFTNNGSTVLLQKGTFGVCQPPKARALVMNGKGGGWVGCWSETEDAYTIEWEDGDHLDIPKAAIKGGTKQRQDRRPATSTDL